MSTALQEQDLQVLYKKYGVPDLVQKWLDETKDFQNNNEYLLHEDICSMHPEDALLCIALCLHIIGKKYNDKLDLLVPIRNLSRDIIKNYAEEALERLHIEINQDERSDIEFVANDLKKLAETLENLESHLSENDDILLSTILSALSIQAGAQAEIAFYVLSNFHEQERKSKNFSSSIVPFLRTLPVNDNRSTN